MTREQHRREIIRKRRRKRQIQKVLFLLCSLLVVVVVSTAVIFKIVGVAQNAKKARATVASNTVANELTIHNNKTQKAEAQKAEDAEDGDESSQEESTDRSDFEVTPGVPVGTETQTDERVIYLTFDDGPSYNTQAVLDILDKYDAKATFFVTGACPEYAGLIKTEYDKGHTIGMHTMTHDYASVYSSVDGYFADLNAIGSVVSAQIGYVPCFIRFTGGSSNTISANYTAGIMSALAPEVQARGYQYYDWNGSCGDGSVKTTEELVAQATSFTDTNLVMLMHDSAGKETTVEALPRVIEFYKNQGYEFKAIDRESYVPHHGIGN